MMKYECKECNSFTCSHQADIQAKIEEVAKNATPYKQPKESEEWQEIDLIGFQCRTIFLHREAQ